MFTNTGAKIQVVTKVFLWLFTIMYIISGVLVMLDLGETVPVFDEFGRMIYNENGELVTKTRIPFGAVMCGVGVMMLGFVLSWAGSLFLIGFGKIVEWVETPYIDQDAHDIPRTPRNDNFLSGMMYEMSKRMEANRTKKEAKRRMLEEYYAKNETQEEENAEPKPNAPKYKCPKCGEMIDHGIERCPHCQQKFKWN